MQDCIAHTEIRFGNKQTHLRRISEVLKIPLEDMVFFDDQHGHCRNARALGVVSVQVPHGGVTRAAFKQILDEFAQSEPGRARAARAETT
mmetsp:Transcript_62200/g.161641  ORF Transcript_62200/g.161641 Transcript_62200/m.161641 type:complete len:90 (+) Transcript_62200:3-272(+)